MIPYHLIICSILTWLLSLSFAAFVIIDSNTIDKFYAYFGFCHTESDDDGKTPFSFDDMYNATLKPRSLQGQWVGGE